MRKKNDIYVNFLIVGIMFILEPFIIRQQDYFGYLIVKSRCNIVEATIYNVDK